MSDRLVAIFSSIVLPGHKALLCAIGRLVTDFGASLRQLPLLFG
jgi:hypothetical protein